VSILGSDPIAERRRLFRRVGVRFQDSAWQPAIRVDELCEATACLYDPLPDWRELPAEFDLDKRSRTAVESLSGAEKQKLSILLACMHGPDLVFLDEVERLCDRGMVLQHGRKVAEGTVEEIRARGAGSTLKESYIRLVGGEARRRSVRC
jgi:ABC-2 type transport system ATP-binding protein